VGVGTFATLPGRRGLYRGSRQGGKPSHPTEAARRRKVMVFLPRAAVDEATTEMRASVCRYLCFLSSQPHLLSLYVSFSCRRQPS
jgi:hypothetical protein